MFLHIPWENTCRIVVCGLNLLLNQKQKQKQKKTKTKNKTKKTCLTYMYTCWILGVKDEDVRSRLPIAMLSNAHQLHPQVKQEAKIYGSL